MKKKFPLAILEALQPVANNNLDLVMTIKDINSMFHLVDRDEKSDFYFKVIKQEIQSGSLKYLIEYKPQSRINISHRSVWSELDNVIININKWLDLINAYNKINTVYDDPIIKGNQERFEKEYISLLDLDAEFTSFDWHQQLHLEEYLIGIQSKINILKEGRSEKEIIELTEIEQEAKEILKVISKETKAKIFKRLTWIWAKAQVIGLDILKQVFVSSLSDLSKYLLTGSL